MLMINVHFIMYSLYEPMKIYEIMHGYIYAQDNGEHSEPRKN